MQKRRNQTKATKKATKQKPAVQDESAHKNSTSQSGVAQWTLWSGNLGIPKLCELGSFMLPL